MDTDTDTRAIAVKSVRGTRLPAGQALLAGLQELLRPAVIQVLVDLFPTAQLRNALFAAKPLQHNPDLLLRGYCRRVARRIALTVFSALPLEWFFFVLIACSFQLTMSSISLLFDPPPFCPTSADVEQAHIKPVKFYESAFSYTLRPSISW